MRSISFAVLFCASLAAASASAAGMDPVVSVEGWPRMSSRVDGKLAVFAYSFGVPDNVPGTTTRAKSQQFLMTIEQGDAAARFAREALRGEVLKSVLFEVFVQGAAKPPSRAPFAVRLTDVRVASVQFGAGRGNEFPGTVNVSLQAGKIEVFTATQDATGAMKPGYQFLWDYGANKGM